MVFLNTTSHAARCALSQFPKTILFCFPSIAWRQNLAAWKYRSHGRESLVIKEFSCPRA